MGLHDDDLLRFIVGIVVVVLALSALICLCRCISYRRNQSRNGRHANGARHCCGCLGSSTRRVIVHRRFSGGQSHGQMLRDLNEPTDSYYGEYSASGGPASANRGPLDHAAAVIGCSSAKWELSEPLRVEVHSYAPATASRATTVLPVSRDASSLDTSIDLSSIDE